MRALIALLVACSSPPPAKPIPRPAVPIDAAIDAAPIDAAIDAAPDAAVAVRAPMPMRTLAGPFASIKAYCASTKVKCGTRTLWTGKRELEKPTAPFDEARLFVAEGPDPHCELGIRIGKKWYVLHDAIRCAKLTTKVVMLDAIDVFADGTYQIVVRAQYDSLDRTHFEAMAFCGLGDSAPRCTRELPMNGTREQLVQGKPVKSMFKLDFVSLVGEMTISGDTSTLESYQFAPLSPGTYTVTF